MKRSIAAFFAGMIAWILVVSLLNRLLRLGIEGYAASEPAMTFTLGMMLARLGMAAVASLVAGAVTRWIAPSSERVAWVMGLVILALFVPSHVMLWHSFPIWYHLTFLVTLVPLVMLGSRWARARTASVAPDPAMPAST